MFAYFPIMNVSEKSGEISQTSFYCITPTQNSFFVNLLGGKNNSTCKLIYLTYFNNKKVITITIIITIMKIIKIQKVIAVIIAIMNNIKSFSNNNSDKSYDQSYFLLIQAFIKLQSFS